MMTFLEKIPPVVNFLTGEITAENVVYKTTCMGSLTGIFQNEVSRKKFDDSMPVYQVEMLTAPEKEGELHFGVSHIEPGVVGDEFFMTRGHFHKRIEQAEYYFGSSGEGLLILQQESGDVICEKVFPGSVHYIPGFIAHRLVNTGNTKLSALAVWPAIAGHDYQALARDGFKVRVFKAEDGYTIVEQEPKGSA